MSREDFFMSQTVSGGTIPLIFMAFAIGMDAFSVSLGIGIRRIRLRRLAFIGIVFGMFHVMMPSFGILLGQIISTRIGHWTTLLGGSLRIVIGVHMLLSAFNRETKLNFNPTGIALIT